MKWLGKWRVLNIQKVHGEVSINISRGNKGSKPMKRLNKNTRTEISR